MLKLLKKLFSSSPSTSTEEQEGTVKFFNYGKGFGFITFKDSDEEIFVHKSDLKTKIKQGNHVTFTVGKSDKGPVAVNVSKITRGR
ncbi:MAG: cold-shock protein [Winogradskyella sp.]|uniref:cold-shock protein n=1 Tax=Winogradskyella sp. TaxID=1883156 RepID=UPI00385AFF95